MARIELLDMPLEVVSTIFQFVGVIRTLIDAWMSHRDTSKFIRWLSLVDICLPGIDLKNLALTCSAVLNIVASTLYRTVRLFYDDPDKNNGFEGLPCLTDIGHLLSSPRFPLGYARRLSVERRQPRASSASLKRTPRGSKNAENELVETADRALELILNRFSDGQLESIRLDHQTTYKIFALICEHQKKVRSLDIGNFRPGGKRLKIPTKTLAPGSLALESLEVCEIDERVTCLNNIIGILNQNSASLRRLRIGDPTHTGRLRHNAGSWARRLWSRTTLPFARIDFPALEQITIVHDHSAQRFWDAFQNIAYCGRKLAHIRISCSTNPYFLIQTLITKGANDIKSIQINNCRLYSRGGAQGFTIKQAPRIKSLETLQIQQCTHEEGEFQAAYTSRATLKRLSLRCSSGCDPKECQSMSGLLDYTSDMSLSSDKWPVLEELAIGAPNLKTTTPVSPYSWLELPMLKSLKILRLLQWQACPANLQSQRDPNVLQSKVEAYVDLVYCWSQVAYEELPNLRIVVIDTGIGHGCPGSCIKQPLYFVAYQLGEPQEGSGILPFVVEVTYEIALSVCKEINCSSYLLRPGLPAPDEIWEDGYKDT